MRHPGPASRTPTAALALLLSTALLSPAAPASDPVGREISGTVCAGRDCPPCVVRIQVRVDESKSGSGTGILLQDGRVLTAAHLLRNASAKNRPEVWFGGRGSRPLVNGAEGRAVTWECHPSADLAAITGVAVPSWARGAALAPSAPKPGETLTVVGIEHTGAVRAYSGALLGLNAECPLLALGLTTQHGDSGGPAFNAAGEVVGILSGAGAFTRSTTTTLEGSGDGTASVTEVRKTPAAFAVDLGRIDWNEMKAPR
jgi:S1-C subfamily serine protease